MRGIGGSYPSYLSFDYLPSPDHEREARCVYLKIGLTDLKQGIGLPYGTRMSPRKGVAHPGEGGLSPRAPRETPGKKRLSAAWRRYD